jgi:hypothetical protein
VGGRLKVVSGLGVLAIGALVGAGCFPPAPPGPASLSVSPNPAGFPTLGPPYNPMPQDTVTVTNTGGHTATNVVVNGIDVYSVPSSTCATLAPGASCQAQIQFCPSHGGSYNETLAVTGNDATTGAPIQGTTQLLGQATN